MSTPLPIIAGIGGINPAGRISFDYAYRRMAIEALGDSDRDATYASLAQLMGVAGDHSTAEVRAYIDAHTLVRRVESFDPDAIYCQRTAELKAGDGAPIEFTITRRHLPQVVPDTWQVTPLDERKVHVRVDTAMNVLIPDGRTSRVTSAGQLPTGFDPGKIFSCPPTGNSRSRQQGSYLPALIPGHSTPPAATPAGWK